jgi:transcriptional regulator with PAS, ATPase and Fis domain
MSGVTFRRRPAAMNHDFSTSRPEETDMAHDWIKEFPGAVTVCDRNGMILEMNDKAALTFSSSGGAELIGKNVFDCHPEPARTKLAAMMGKREIHVYTIEKNGVKKLIYQAPWTRDGKYGGFVELAVEIPFDMPHFIRKP